MPSSRTRPRERGRSRPCRKAAKGFQTPWAAGLILPLVRRVWRLGWGLEEPAHERTAVVAPGRPPDEVELDDLARSGSADDAVRGRSAGRARPRSWLRHQSPQADRRLFCIL